MSDSSHSDLEREAARHRREHAQLPDRPAELSKDALIHELQVYQVELEQQNAELRETQLTLQDSRAKYRELFDLAPTGFVSLSFEGTIVNANLAAAELLDRSRTDLAGRPLALLLPVSERPGFLTALRTALNRGRRELEVSFDSRAGVRHLRLSLNRLERDSPAGASFLCAMEDLTAVRQAEAEREAYQRHLLQVQKLESLGVLAGGFAHDFNNLLMAIQGNLDLADHRAGQPERARERLREARACVERGAQLCQQLLTYSGQKRLARTTVDVSEVLREVVSLVGASCDAPDRLQVHVDEACPQLTGDRPQIQQLLLNLVLNAVEAVEDRDDGTIEIRARGEDSPIGRDRHTIVPGAEEQGPHVVIEVADTGPGLPSEDVNTLFDPFFTTKFQGRGLGLAAALGIVRAHHGRIRVHDDGRRTVFRVDLPASGPGPPGEDRPDTAPSGSETTPRVLVVDDDPAVVRVLQDLLGLQGWTVITANTCAQALSAVEGSAETPFAAAMVDLSLPDGDGLGLISSIAGIAPATTCLLMTGSAAEEIQESATRAGAVSVLVKPFRAADLEQVLPEFNQRDPRPPAPTRPR